MSLGSACLNSSYCLEACTGSCVPQPAHHEPLASIYEGDCVAVMAEFPEASVDAIVTDPPYSLGFMGKAWDVQVEHAPWARAAYRDALVVQAARDAAETLKQEKSRELTLAWDKVYRLQRQLMEGTE